jgi:putative ABC transport system permease protein
MINTFKIAIRNLLRYKRRSLLTSLLITVGVVMVILFSGLSGSFKQMMVGLITDATLAQIQIHKKGYVSSIDTIPLNLNLKPQAYKKITNMLEKNRLVESYSPRIKLGAILSNYKETTNIRLNAIQPDSEIKVCPALPDRITFKNRKAGQDLLNPGEIIIPDKLAKGLDVKHGDTVVLVAHNRDGSVNGLNFMVAGVIESVAGPQGKEGYIHIKDARDLLRIDVPEVTEVAIRTGDFQKIDTLYAELKDSLSEFKNPRGKPEFEIHTWEALSPFYNIARMIDLMSVSMKIIMIAIVLISILNVMMMSVYERVREIGTIAAIGTAPGKIMGLFLSEGFSLGFISTLFANIIGIGAVYILNIYKIRFSFGRTENLLLSPTVNYNELIWVSVIVLLVSILATLQPAYKASKMEPVDALRHV